MKVLEQARPNLPQKAAKPTVSAPTTNVSKQPAAASKNAAKSEPANDDYDTAEVPPVTSKSSTSAPKGGKPAKPGTGGTAAGSAAKKVLRRFCEAIKVTPAK